MFSSGFDEPLASDAAEQIERLCDLFERDLQAGQARPISDYLETLPAAVRPAAFRALLGVELGYLADTHRAADAQHYLARYPDYAGAIAQVFGVPLVSPMAARQETDVAAVANKAEERRAVPPAKAGRRLLLWSAVVVLMLAAALAAAALLAP